MIQNFRLLPIAPSFGKRINNVFYVVEKERAKVMESLLKLPKNIQDDFKILISKIATIENYKSPKIKYSLNKYSFGEIRPFPYRFFFFRKCGNNIIFFHFEEKKKDSLKDEIYKRIEKEQLKYGKAFEEFIRRS